MRGFASEPRNKEASLGGSSAHARHSSWMWSSTAAMVAQGRTARFRVLSTSQVSPTPVRTWSAPHSAWTSSDSRPFLGSLAYQCSRVVLLDRATSVDQLGFSAPFIVKPRYGGSSIGMEVVADLDSAKALFGSSPHLQRGAVLEPYRQDLFDLNVAVRTWPSLELSAVERPERTTVGAEILGYADKYVGAEGMASAPRELPASIPVDLRDRLSDVARRTSRDSSA